MGRVGSGYGQADVLDAGGLLRTDPKTEEELLGNLTRPVCGL